MVFDLNYFQFIRVAFLGSRYWIGFAQFIVLLFLICVGMGLAIVHNIVEAHDGDIKVESLAGKCTTVTIRLPIENSHP